MLSEKRKRARVAIAAFVILFCGLVALSTAAQLKQATKISPTDRPVDISLSEWQAKLKRDIIPNMSGMVGLILAERLGMKEICGKPLGESKPSPRKHFTYNVPVSTEYGIYENEPSIAIDPTNDHYVIALNHYAYSGTNYIVARTSYDGGGSFWESPVYLPFSPNAGVDEFLSDPVVRYEPDGYYAVAAYISVRGDASTSDLIFTRSSNGGFSWSGATVVWPGSTGYFVDKPWIDVHRYDTTKAMVLYITFTLFTPSNSVMALTYSLDDGANWWNNAWALQWATTDVVQGGRAIGVKGGSTPGVVAAWYWSGTDGIRTGKFNIQTRYIPDVVSGAYYSAPAAANCAYECPAYLGPSGAYHRWWGTMFPSIDIGPDNRVFIAFSVDPVTNPTSAEDGDVYVTYSLNSTYTSWVAKKKMGYGGAAAQGYPTIVTQRQADGKYKVYLSWMHHDGASKNLYYDFWRKVSINNGGAFASPKKISGYKSISDYLFIGDYNDSSAHPRRVLAIWTDRSHVTSKYDYDDDVICDRID